MAKKKKAKKTPKPKGPTFMQTAKKVGKKHKGYFSPFFKALG